MTEKYLIESEWFIALKNVTQLYTINKVLVFGLFGYHYSSSTPPPKKKKNEKEQKTLSANRKIQFPQILNWLYVDCKKFMHKNNSKSKLDQNHEMDLQFDLYRVFSVWTFESYFTCEI